MKNILTILLAFAVAGCTTKQNGALIITKVIPPTATAGTSASGTPSVSCSFDPGGTEFTPYLPFNPAENRGLIAGVVLNQALPNFQVNSVYRADTAAFLPHQAVVSYELINAPGVATPGQITVPTSGIEVTSGGGTGTVGFAAFFGVDLSPMPEGSYVRVTFHFEGKMADNSTVHTSEREYLFRICKTTGCADGGPWAASVTTGTGATAVTSTVSCL